MKDPEGFFIVSQLEPLPGDEIQIEQDDLNLLSGVTIKVARAEGSKCPRCWIWSTTIGSHSEFPDVCPRCAGVLSDLS